MKWRKRDNKEKSQKSLTKKRSLSKSETNYVYEIKLKTYSYVTEFVMSNNLYFMKHFLTLFIIYMRHQSNKPNY